MNGKKTNNAEKRCLRCKELIHVSGSPSAQSCDTDALHLTCTCAMDHYDRWDAYARVKSDLKVRHCTQSFALSVLPVEAFEEASVVLNQKCVSCLFVPPQGPPRMKYCTAQCCISNSSQCLFEVLRLLKRYGLQGMSKEQFIAFQAFVTENGTRTESYDAFTIEGLLM